MQIVDEIISGIFEKQKQLGLSNQQLADAADMSRAALERMKRGETQAPSAQNLFALAAAVGYQITKDEETPTDGLSHTIAMYEDRIARLRSHYNMQLAERNRMLRYAFYTIGGLLLADFLMVILLIVIIHL